MNHTAVGRRAEQAVDAALTRQGFRILSHNWRTRWCEIDVVATKQSIAYFVEVKYRQNNRFGDGLDYITPQKLKQMHFAAELWCAQHRWLGDYELLAASVSGTDYTVERLVSCS